jgi:hypothetical protein
MTGEQAHKIAGAGPQVGPAGRGGVGREALLALRRPAAVAIHFEGKMLWDANKMKFTNHKEATKWIKPTFRKGWEVKL